MFLIYGVEKVSSESQTEEVNKSPGRDEIMEGKEKETELAELEDFFDSIDMLNGCYQTCNRKPFF